MSLVKHKFSHRLDADFFKSLHKRVNEYFAQNNRSMYGDWRLMIKTVAMLGLFFIPYALMFTDWVTSPWVYMLLWIGMGLGTAGIGVNVMHDANHGVFSKNKTFNKIAEYVMNLLGGDAAIWRMQHNVLHHSFTNIHEADEDIIGPPLLRFSPHDDKKDVHRYQHIYAWFLYGLMTIIKLTYTDFKRAIRYRKMELIKDNKELSSRILKIISGKIFYVTYMIAMPLIFAPFAWWLTLLGFLVMHIICGFILSIIFQTAHVMTTSEFPLPDEEGRIENNWAVHQMLTTTNFSPKSRIFSWFIGGLNYQIEHHLFAGISHVHYRDLSKVVAETAKEYGIPYHCQKNFVHALRDHGKMLYQLGR